MGQRDRVGQLPDLSRYLGRMRRRVPGSRPGTLVIDETAPPPKLHYIGFNATEIREVDLGPDLRPETPDARDPTWSVAWTDVVGLGDAAVLEKIAVAENIHALVLEDIVHTHQRPKAEEYDNGLFIVCRMLRPGSDGFEDEQLAIWVSKRTVVTFQERAGDVFDPVRARIHKSKGKIRSSGADYLVYALLDCCVDAYFPILESFGEQLAELELAVLTNPSRDLVVQLLRLKRELTMLRRACWPMREMIQELLRSEGSYFDDSTKVYLRDVYDHVIQILDLVESHRDIASSLMDLYLSSLSHRMNEVMKVLTIISTIFIPMTFLAGLYGMNFDTKLPGNMPELGIPYAYPILLATFIAIVISMLLWFRRLGWLRRVQF